MTRPGVHEHCVDLEETGCCHISDLSMGLSAPLALMENRTGDGTMGRNGPKTALSWGTVCVEGVCTPLRINNYRTAQLALNRLLDSKDRTSDIPTSGLFLFNCLGDHTPVFTRFRQLIPHTQLGCRPVNGGRADVTSGQDVGDLHGHVGVV